MLERKELGGEVRRGGKFKSGGLKNRMCKWKTIGERGQSWSEVPPGKKDIPRTTPKGQGPCSKGGARKRSATPLNALQITRRGVHRRGNPEELRGQFCQVGMKVDSPVCKKQKDFLVFKRKDKGLKKVRLESVEKLMGTRKK